MNNLLLDLKGKSTGNLSFATILGLMVFISQQAFAQSPDLLQTRGFCIAAPSSQDLDRFIKFMDEDLAPGGFNTLVLRIDFDYEYQSYPQLRSENPLTRDEVKRIVQAAKQNNIELIPQLNLLGHQSWAEDLNMLLKVFPEFDETPQVEMPEEYEWPNKDGLYCKSYCPLHPEVHTVVFALIDEIMEVFEAKNFHAGMDEVFYIGHDQCTRCAGKDKAELFAGEVTKLQNHLAENGHQLWIWGDRLLDGTEMGLGMWEASTNDTHRAIDMIPTEVVICDWHYVRAEPTAAYFALKGFNVISCPWNQSEVAEGQIKLINNFKQWSNEKVGGRYQGVMHTVWSPAASFLNQYYAQQQGETNGTVKTYKVLKQHFTGN